MPSKLSVLSLIALLFLTSVTASQAQDTENDCFECDPTHYKPQLRIATIDWCPYVCPEDQAKPGILVEYVKEIFKNSPVELIFKPMPWSRAIFETENGRFDALLAPAKEEAPTLIFPSQHIAFQRMCLFVDKSDSWRYTGFDSLKERRIIYAYDAFPKSLEPVRKQASFYPIPYSGNFIPRAIRMLIHERFDTMLFTYYSTQHYLNQANYSHNFITAGCVQEQPVYLAFSPKSELQQTNQRFINTLEKVLSTEGSTNVFNRLLEKYHLKPFNQSGIANQ